MIDLPASDLSFFPERFGSLYFAVTVKFGRDG